jgi:hypothetical protein
MKNLIFISIAFMVFFGCANNNPVSSLYPGYDYSIEQSWNCFCPNSGMKVKVFVKADTIANVILLSDNSYLPYDLWGRYRTIKGLFSEAASYDTLAYNVSVSYDSVFHYPSMIYVGRKPIIINDTLVAGFNDVWFQIKTRNFIPYR